MYVDELLSKLKIIKFLQNTELETKKNDRELNTISYPE